MGELGLVVLTGDGRVIEDISSPFFPLLALLPKRPHEAISGPCLLALDRFEQPNYAHWLLDGVPRLLGLTLEEGIPPCIARPRITAPWQKSFCDIFYRSPDFGVIPFTKYSAETLTVPAYGGGRVPHPAYKAHPRAVEFIKDLASERIGHAGTLSIRNLAIILIRRSTRQLHGVELLSGKLVSAGYTTIMLDPDTASFESQWRLFREAKVVIGVHGAGLASSIFMNAQTCMVEIFPEDFGNPAFWMIASQCGIRHIGVTQCETLNMNLLPQKRDVSLTKQAIDSIVDTLGKVS